LECEESRDMTFKFLDLRFLLHFSCKNLNQKIFDEILLKKKMKRIFNKKILSRILLSKSISYAFLSITEFSERKNTTKRKGMSFPNLSK